MARARLEADHDRNARLMAWVGNMLRDPRKGKPIQPEDLNPYADRDAARARRRAQAIPAEIDILRTFIQPDHQRPAPKES